MGSHKWVMETRVNFLETVLRQWQALFCHKGGMQVLRQGHVGAFLAAELVVVLWIKATLMWVLVNFLRLVFPTGLCTHKTVLCLEPKPILPTVERREEYNRKHRLCYRHCCRHDAHPCRQHQLDTGLKLKPCLKSERLYPGAPRQYQSCPEVVHSQASKLG